MSTNLSAQFEVSEYESTDIARDYKAHYDSTTNQPLESLYDYIGQTLLCNYPSNWSPIFYSDPHSKKLYKEKTIQYNRKDYSYGTRIWELCNALPNGIYTETFTPEIYLQKKKFKVVGIKRSVDKNIYLVLSDESNQLLFYSYGSDSQDPEYKITDAKFPFICEGFYEKCKQVFEGKSYSYSYNCVFGHLNPFSDYVTKHKIKGVLIRPNISKVILEVFEIKQNLKDFTVTEKSIESYELDDIISNGRYIPSELEKIIKGNEYKDDYKAITNEPYENIIGYKGEELIYFFTDSLSIENIRSNSARLGISQFQLSNGQRFIVTDVIIKKNDYPLLELKSTNGRKLYYSYQFDGWDSCVKPVYNFPFITLSFYKKACELVHSTYETSYYAGRFKSIVTNVYLDSTKVKVKVEVSTKYKSTLESENKTISNTYTLSDFENSTISNLDYLLEDAQEREKKRKH
jgi:hypothetical protein